ncbi:MAG: hypothetical protein B6242_00715 [Anaerolineaceae bacterium 4572_78]|nr:MAG: hypothetical protein B6242_00715 [Anaerolineaceae bacterium 4572_78]
MLRKLFILIIGIVLIIISLGCQSTTPESEPVFVPIQITSTVTQVMSTETIVKSSSEQQSQPEPSYQGDAIAYVNGETILRTDFEKQVEQFQKAEKANGIPQTEEHIQQIREHVLDGLIDQHLIEQTAKKHDIVINDNALNAEIAEIKQGQTESEFNQWLELNNFTYQEFKEMLRSELISGHVFDYIVANVPTVAVHVHVRHILLKDQNQAHETIQRLNNGEDFVMLAQTLSQDELTRLNGGDLGWFPRGVNIVPPQVETIAFTLAPGDISPVIESVFGYHIILLAERDESMTLIMEHYHKLQRKFFSEWLAEQRSLAKIEIY